MGEIFSQIGTMAVVFFGVIALAALGLTILGFHLAAGKGKGWAWSLVVLGICGMSFGGGMGAITWIGMQGVKEVAGELGAMAKREQQYRAISYQLLGNHLREKHAGAKAIIFDPSSAMLGIVETSPLAQAMEGVADNLQAPVEELQENLGPEVEVLQVASVSVSEDAGPEAILAAMSPSVQHCDETIAAFPEADMLIFLGALPPNWRTMACLQNEEKRPKIVLASHTAFGVRADLESGVIVAALVMRLNDTSLDAPIPADMQEAFDQRYVLVTPENVAEIAKDQKVIGL